MYMVHNPKMNYQKAVVEILDSVKTSIRDKAQAENLFQFSGTKAEGSLMFISFMGDPDSCVKTLMGKLSSIPAVKVSAVIVIEAE